MKELRKDPNHNRAKSTMPEMKNTLNRVKGRLDTAEDKNCNFVDIAMEINKNETEGEKKCGG